MNSTRRFAGRIGSALALFGLLSLGFARADSPAFVFNNHQLTFTHIARQGSGTAVGVNDPGFRNLLSSLGATLTWHPGERYVLISTPQPVVLNFAIGDRRYDNGLLSSQASFAPFTQGQEAYLPLDDVLRALSLAQVRDGNTTVLQPLLTSVDVQGSQSQAVIVAHAAVALHARVVSDTADRVVYEFNGVASSIDGSRAVDAGGVRSMQVTTGGGARDPHVTITMSLYPGTRHDAAQSRSGDFEVGFGANGGAPPLIAAGAAPQASAPEPTASEAPTIQPQQPAVTPAPASQATVNAVVVQANGGGSNVNITVTGNAQYEWHRLREPDNRFWIDIKGAVLAGGPREENEADPLISMRVRQNDAQTVRIALSFTGPKSVNVSPSANGVSIAIGNDEVADAPRFGDGTIGSVVSANDPQPLVTPVPADMYGQNPNPDWKFGGSNYVPTNPKLIIIDPGHGGSDVGAVRAGYSEKNLAFDMAKRLQAILISRGWQVQMTRTEDVDVFAPNDSARDELQARVDIANNAGARMLISIHVNSFINSGPHGTTTYYSKPSDVALARAISDVLGQTLDTKNDGIVKSKLYMTLHSYMPAALIETAFLSNPDDLQKLISPEWRQKVAQGIADGIDRYANQYPVSGSSGQ